MRVPSMRASAAKSFNITPMIDVVMLLIVFFLLAGHLSRQEVQQELDLPTAESGRSDDETDDRRRIIVNILPTGEILFAGQPVSASEFSSRLQAESARVGPELEVRLRADKSVLYDTVEPLLVRCAELGIWRVSFSVIEK